MEIAATNGTAALIEMDDDPMENVDFHYGQNDNEAPIIVEEIQGYTDNDRMVCNISQENTKNRKYFYHMLISMFFGNTFCFCFARCIHKHIKL